MKKAVMILAVFISFTLVFSKDIYALTVPSENKAYNWYFKKSKNGEQPESPSEFGFVSECGGYSIDKNAPSRNDKVIYLTFDCGYENGNVERILDVLKKHNAKSAFFVLGNLVKRNTSLVKRMNDEGHLVCNHTCSHKNMTKITNKSDFEKELKALSDLTEQMCGFSLAPYYRPPEGCFNKQNLIWANELGYKTIFWSFAYDDWDNNRQMSGEKALEKLISGLHNGEVLLLHPTSQTNADILDAFLTELENRGYRFGTLDELVSTN